MPVPVGRSSRRVRARATSASRSTSPTGLRCASTADRLRMAVVHDADAGLWAIGPESLGDRALVTAEAPELTLPDLDGNEFRLSSLRGQKVVIVSWAPY